MSRTKPPRVGVFACSCGSTIGEVIDLAALVQHAAQWPGVVRGGSRRLRLFPRSARRSFRRAFSDANLNRVVIAACSNRTHEALFQRTLRLTGLNPYLLELVNLREQCSRVHQQQRALANRKAQELVRVAVGRVLAAQPVHKDKNLCQPAALIIGGGVTGMTAALAIADSGYDVHLVERTEMLGGNLANLYYVAEGYDPQRLLRDLVNRVRAHRRIVVHTRTEVMRHTGHVGNFQAELRTKYPDGTARRISHRAWRDDRGDGRPRNARASAVGSAARDHAA